MAANYGSVELGRADDAGPVASERRGEPPALTVICRALLVLGAVGFSVGLCLGVVLLKDPLFDYLTQNSMRPKLRLFVLDMGIGGFVLLVLSGLGFAWLGRPGRSVPRSLERLSGRLAPLGVVVFLPFLFQWKVWKDRDLSFLALVALSSFVFESGLRSAIATGPLAWEVLVRRRVRLAVEWLSRRLPRAAARAPLLIVCAAALGYAVHFSYYTILWHRAVRSGFDLSIENNILWNLIHGGPFFKASPITGPKGSHFGHHATLFAIVLGPVYALAARPEMLLALQSVFLGFASIPLFLWARLRVSAWLACAIAVGYLLDPSVHNTNIFEFHYLPLGTFFLWLTLYALETRRAVLSVVAIVLTLTVREDVAAMLAVIGAYLLVSGSRPKAGLAIAFIGAVYFVTMKMFVMRLFEGGEAFTFMFNKLLPAGENSFAGVLKTAVGNPWYTMDTLLEEGKLVYLLQMLVPLAFIPMRRPLSLLLAIPGFLFTLLSTGYSPTISLHYHYTAYWTTFLFPALVLVLSKMAPVRRGAAVGALAFSLVTTSYQYGSLFQKNTSFGGPIPYKFGMNQEDRRRRAAFDKVVVQLPPRAKVVGSAFATVQVSSRPDAYSLTLGVYDADYLLIPSVRQDFIVDERQTVTRLLTDKSFGVVAIEPPFALARRGADTARNEELLGLIR